MVLRNRSGARIKFTKYLQSFVIIKYEASGQDPSPQGSCNLCLLVGTTKFNLDTIQGSTLHIEFILAFHDRYKRVVIVIISIVSDVNMQISKPSQGTISFIKRLFSIFEKYQS